MSGNGVKYGNVWKYLENDCIFIFPYLCLENVWNVSLPDNVNKVDSLLTFFSSNIIVLPHEVEGTNEISLASKLAGQCVGNMVLHG